MCFDNDISFNVEWIHKCVVCNHTWISNVFGERCPECGSIFVVPDKMHSVKAR